MIRISQKRVDKRSIACLIAALVIAPGLAPANDLADTPELAAMKSYWQDRYRDLKLESERLRVEIAEQTELYADANRRNYRRGKKRHIHRTAAQKASDRLAEVEAELASIEDDARRAGALPGWFYEVDFELQEEDALPGIASGPDDEDDAGRNPLYLDDEDD